MSESLRILAACASCGLQFDASALPAGGRFHCACGETIEVPGARPHDAAVVRCSSCGAPRRQGADACVFCGSDFTLHERDLRTLCPACMSRISDRGRFCHSCGLPIAPQGFAGEATERTCPACGEDRRLFGKRFDAARVGLLECPRCAGIWLGNAAFRALEKQAMREETSLPGRAGGGPPAPGAGPVYRPCPVCGKLMHRRNFGRKSGIIVDTCAADGVWFDHGELDSVLDWVRRGGLRRAQEGAREERRQRERLERLAPAPAPVPPGGPVSRGGAFLEMVRRLAELLLSG